MKVLQKQGNNTIEIDVENLLVDGKPLSYWILEITKLRKDLNNSQQNYANESSEAKRLWNELKK
jgi:hypothetical protein